MSKDEWIAMFREIMDIGGGTGPAERPLRSTPSDWSIPPLTTMAWRPHQMTTQVPQLNSHREPCWFGLRAHFSTGWRRHRSSSKSAHHLWPWGLAANSGLLNTASRTTASRSVDSRDSRTKTGRSVMPTAAALMALTTQGPLPDGHDAPSVVVRYARHDVLIWLVVPHY